MNKTIDLGYPAAWDCYHYRIYGAPGSDKQHHVLWTHIYTNKDEEVLTGELMSVVKMYEEGTRTTSPGTVKPMVYVDDVVGIVNTVLDAVGCKDTVKIDVDEDGRMSVSVESTPSET